MNVLVTGGAGFIGSHLCERLLRRGDRVWCIDNFDPFYDPAIKLDSVENLRRWPNFRSVPADVTDLSGMEASLAASGAPPFDVIVHLAARAGVRPSIEDPILYSRVNLDGTMAVLELAKRLETRRVIFGSSSSVYGNHDHVPFSESQPVGQPISPYAATKRAGELICHTYHHLWGMSIACLRFFTVYGPRQRPDLAIHKFTRALAASQPVTMYGDGSTERDYTHVDDIVTGIEGAIEYTGSHPGSFEIFNLGGSRTTSLRRLIEMIADALGTAPEVRPAEMQPGDVRRTFADVRKAHALLGYLPRTRIEDGIPRFVEWYLTSQGLTVERTVTAPPIHSPEGVVGR